MVSLVDIVPQKRVVETTAGRLELRGLGLRQIADLLLRFPNLRKLFVEGASAFDVETLLIMAPDAIGAIIAEAAGQPDAADAVADSLPVDDLTECLVAVRDLTMPGGATPFLARIERLFGTSLAEPGKAPAMTSPPQPNGSLPADTIAPP